MKSSLAVIFVTIIWFLAGTFYYPKWKNQYSEATISWDVSGYYHYLPAIFIYNDIKQQLWIDSVNQKYLPSPAYDQAFVHEKSGNKINKYAIGQSVLFSPFFLTAHAYTSITHAFPADGYSRPYQIAIWLGGLLFSILGLIVLRKILGYYFTDIHIAWTIVAIGLGTHLLEYAAISNGMNHNWLFTLLCVLILFTIRFYRKSDWISATAIGVSLGLAVLTRPTEIVWVLIPLLWGLTSLKSRITFLADHWKKCLLAILIAGLIISIQMIYWKYASGEWIVYSYRDQGFDWLQPKIWRGLMGVKVGWWTYTPIMFVAMFGWYQLYKKHHSVFWAVALTSLLAVYITFSWPYWETGGGLGQRNLIQVYPLMAFPLASIIEWLARKTMGKWLWILILTLNIYYSMWWIHQAHKGGMFHPGQMTTPFFYRVAGRIHPNKDLLKLLDTREYFQGQPVDSRIIYEEDFESDSSVCMHILQDNSKATCLNEPVQTFGPVSLQVDKNCGSWIRAEATITVQSREWDFWKFAQWIVQFKKGDQVIKTNFIRLQRLISEDQIPKSVFFDVKLPEKDFDTCTMSIWNAGSKNTILIDDVLVSCFKEK